MGATGSVIGDSETTKALATEQYNILDPGHAAVLEGKQLDDIVDRVIAAYKPDRMNISEKERNRLKRTIHSQIERENNSKLTMEEFIALFLEIATMLELITKATEQYAIRCPANSGYLKSAELCNVAHSMLIPTATGGTVGTDTEEMLSKVTSRLKKQIELDLYEFCSVLQDVFFKIQLVKRAKKKFEDFDLNHNGVIEGYELTILIAWILSQYCPQARGAHGGKDFNVAEFKKRLMRRIDVNHDGKLDLTEFIVLFEEIMVKIELQKASYSKFVELDKQHVESLRQTALYALNDFTMKQYGEMSETTTAADIEDCKNLMIRRIRNNPDITLSFFEFTKLLDEVTERVMSIKRAREKFREMDTTRSGKITVAQANEVTDHVLGKMHVDLAGPMSPLSKTSFKGKIMESISNVEEEELNLEQFINIFEEIYEATVTLTLPLKSRRPSYSKSSSSEESAQSSVSRNMEIPV